MGGTLIWDPQTKTTRPKRNPCTIPYTPQTHISLLKFMWSALVCPDIAIGRFVPGSISLSETKPDSIWTVRTTAGAVPFWKMGTGLRQQYHTAKRYSPFGLFYRVWMGHGLPKWPFDHVMGQKGDGNHALNCTTILSPITL